MSIKVIPGAKDRIQQQPNPQRCRKHRLCDFELQRESLISSIAQFPLHKYDEEDAGCKEGSAKMRYEIVGAVERVEEVENCGKAQPDKNGSRNNKLEDPDCGEESLAKILTLIVDLHRGLAPFRSQSQERKMQLLL